MEEAPVGIVVTDFTQDDNPIVYANEAFTEITGYSNAETVGRNCRFLQGPETDPEPVARMRDAVDAGESVTVELRNYRKDGSQFWNRVSIAPLESDSEVTGFVGFQENISARKARERELRREQAFTEQSLDALEDVFYVFSPAGEILRWNDRLGEVTGYSEREIAEMGPTDFFPEEHSQRIAEAVAKVLETGSARVQAEYLTADGERIPYEFTGQRLTEPDGEIRGFVGIGRDITQRLEHEQKVRERTERLEEFTSMVSHDLRNPLNMAQGHLQLARENHESDHLTAVAAAHERMEQLIEDLLSLATDGDVALAPRPVSLAAVVEDSWQTVETKEATLAVETEDTVEADESLLRQLLANLFRNAIDHGGPEVTVTVGPLADQPGFFVADDGPGIAEAARERLFESGFTTAEGGIGKGLSIVERVADAHDWTVAVTDSGAGGARFEIRLHPDG
jgi:PAS domain S-box-containing protein